MRGLPMERVNGVGRMQSLMPWLLTLIVWFVAGLVKMFAPDFTTAMVGVACLLLVAAPFVIGIANWRNLLCAFRFPVGRLGLLIVVGYLLGTVSLFMLLHVATWQDDLSQLLNPALLPASVLAAVFIVPLYEELFFRGAFQSRAARLLETRLDSRRSALWSIYLSALVFWLFHAPLHLDAWRTAVERGAIPLSPGPFFLGLVCGFIAWRDRSLWFAIIFHALANLLGPLWAGLLPPSLLGLFYSARLGM